MRPWVLVLTGSLLLGAALGAAAPASWMLRWTDGLLLGAALYVAGLRRFVERHEAEAEASREAEGGGAHARGFALASAMAPGLLLRAALFVAILSVQAYFCFTVVPDADVRRGFIVLSAWVVMQTLIDTGTTRGPAVARVSAASPPPAR